MTAADVYDAMFERRTELEVESNERIDVIEPDLDPKVKTTRREAQEIWVTEHTIEDSDCHKDASDDEPETLTPSVRETKPTYDPCTVTDAEPVPARLPRRAMLSPAMSADHPEDTLPPRSPAVITTRRVPRAPCPTMHLIDVSDSHSVVSDAVPL